MVANGISVNSTGTYVSGTVNSTSYSIGSSFVANSTNLSLTDTQISITKTVGSTTALVINQTAASGAAAAVTINQNSVSGSSLSVNHFSSGPYGLLLTANSGTGAYIRSYTGIPLVVGNVTSTFVGVYANGNVGIGTSTPDALLKVAADANVTGNVVIGGSLTAANVTASLFTGNVTGTSSNATNLNNQPGSYYTNATNISTGTLVDARLSANYNTGTALTANNANYLGTIPASSYVNTSQLSASLSNYLLTYNGTVNGAIYQTGGGLGSVANGVYVNATSIFVGNSSVNVSINATSFSGTSSNATNLNNQPGSYYTNATNITTGTLADARLSANYSTGTALTANNASYLGGVAVASYVNTSGNFTVSGNINFTAANNVINATSHTVGSSFVANSTVLNTTGSLSAANLTTTTNVATIGTSSYFVSNGNVGIGTSTPDALLKVTGAANVTGNVVIGGSLTAANVTASLFTGNVTGTSSNATNLNNQPSTYYTNATNITTGTLPWGQAPAGTVNTSGNFTVSGNINFTAANNVINATSHTVGSSFVANSTVLNTTGSLSSANLTTTTNTVTIGTAAYHVANGNFGIGTSTPDSQLKVVGYANITIAATFGNTSSGSTAVYAYSNNQYAIYAVSNSAGAIVGNSNSSYGVYGSSISSYGVYGLSASNYGVIGSSNTYYGVYGLSNTSVGVVARSTSGNPLIAGNTTSDLFGVYANGNIGIGSSSPPTTLHINAGGYAGIMLGTNDTSGIVLTKEVSDNSFNIWQGSYGISGVSRFKLDVNGNIKLTGNTFVVANSSAVNTFGVYANGNIGIGTSSPPYNVSVQGSPNATIHLSDGTVRGGVSSNTPVSGAFYVGSYSSHPLTIGTVNAERMRIDTSGNVGIGTSSPSYKLDVSGDIRSTANVSGNNSTFVKSFIGSSTDTSGVQNIRFGFGSAGIGSYYNNVDTLGSLLHPLWFITNGATVGHISVDGSSTYYMSSSDYRLKTNVKPLVSGLNTINSLKPVSYTWIKNNQQGEGFIAHELQEIIPLAVSGQKDAVDDQGNIVAQGIDPSKLVVHLVVSIQELSQKIEDLTTKLKSSGIEV